MADAYNMLEDIDSLLRPLTATTHLPLLEPIRPPAGKWNHATQLMYFRRLPSACRPPAARLPSVGPSTRLDEHGVRNPSCMRTKEYPLTHTTFSDTNAFLPNGFDESASALAKAEPELAVTSCTGGQLTVCAECAERPQHLRHESRLIP